MAQPLQDVLREAQEIADTLDNVIAPQGDHWQITNRSAAEWAMKKLYSLQTLRLKRRLEAEHYLAPLQAQIRLIQDWLEAELAMLDDQAEFFRGHLIKYLAHERATNPKLKSIKLPHGTIASRKKPDTVVVHDEQLAIQQAKAAGWTELVRVTEALDKRALKDAVLKDGQVIEGVEPVAGDTEYHVKVAEVAE